MNRWYRVAALGLALVCAPLFASAKPVAPQPSAKARASVRVVTPSEAVRLQAARKAAPARAAGAQIVVDPETGEKRQLTHEEWKALHARDRRGAEAEAGAQAAPAEPVAVQLPGGAVAVELPEEFMSEMVAVKNADGSVTMRCVPAAERKQAMQPQKSARPVAEEK